MKCLSSPSATVDGYRKGTLRSVSMMYKIAVAYGHVELLLLLFLRIGI